ncbi:hypothetical protein [Uliginosibacterium sp. 31-12]|uniref:hypothetical protein n=1 Tax=Uliginosibacterium sp. 31-12 TaxID=3062781 RepID=UPI0026E34001|nr:hypothetical protein [Uliginosibacterium sp. 31-12]MDO6385423.1 hypothetical protein [Uliginosibacterium sp. 31-12]
MPEGVLNTRQINALRALLERRDFTPEDVALLDYHTLSRMPGIGGKSLNIIRGWLAANGLDLANSPDDYRSSLRFCRLQERLVKARRLLEKNGYEVAHTPVDEEGGGLHTTGFSSP